MDNMENNNQQADLQPQQEKKGMAIASLVLGIVGVVFGCAWYIGIPCGIVGLILGIMANKAKKSGMGTAGIVLSIIALVVGIIWMIVGLTVGLGAQQYLSTMNM